jgi:hypothetical protein
MPILKNNKHELFAHPDYNRARWRRRHGKPGRLDRSFRPGSWRSVVDDKFYANLASKMDEGELNTIANELLEGIRRDGESRREHLEMLSEGFKALGLVIETATATSVSSSAPLEGMSAVRHPLLFEACLLFRANAMDEMLPAAGPVKVRDDRSQKPSRRHEPVLHSAGAASAGTSYAGNPPRPASALPAAVPRILPLPPGCALCDRRLLGQPRRWVRLPLLALSPVLGRAPPGAAHAGNGRHSGRARVRRDRGRA